jgi:hypothetical protein
MHASLELGLDRAQLRLQPLANRLPQDRESSVASLLSADVRKAEEVERFRFPFSRLNFRIRSISSAQNRTASAFP